MGMGRWGGWKGGCWVVATGPPCLRALGHPCRCLAPCTFPLVPTSRCWMSRPRTDQDLQPLLHLALLRSCTAPPMRDPDMQAQPPGLQGGLPHSLKGCFCSPPMLRASGGQACIWAQLPALCIDMGGREDKGQAPGPSPSALSGLCTCGLVTHWGRGWHRGNEAPRGRCMPHLRWHRAGHSGSG